MSLDSSLVLFGMSCNSAEQGAAPNSKQRWDSTLDSLAGSIRMGSEDTVNELQDYEVGMTF
jgi:hypothetical protein